MILKNGSSLTTVTRIQHTLLRCCPRRLMPKVCVLIKKLFVIDVDVVVVLVVVVLGDDEGFLKKPFFAQLHYFRYCTLASDPENMA